MWSDGTLRNVIDKWREIIQTKLESNPDDPNINHTSVHKNFGSTAGEWNIT